MPAVQDTLEIAVLAYPGAQAAAVHGLTDLFAVANRLAAAQGGGRLPLRVCHWQAGSGAPEPVFDSHPGHGGRRVAVVIPPSLAAHPDASTVSACCPWLIEQHGQGAILSAVCIGAFLLAETGLLDGRRVTTHASQARQLAEAFPALKVEADAPIIDDGDLITSAGLMAWAEVGLRLVARLLGGSVAQQTAHFLAVEYQGQGDGHFNPVLGHGDSAVLRLQHWLQAKGAVDVSIASMAAHAGLEARTLLRRFRAATGLNPTQYCQQLRVGRAREMLEWTHDTVDHIAWTVGYQDPATFRVTFRRITGLAPSEYRRCHARLCSSEPGRDPSAAQPRAHRLHR